MKINQDILNYLNISSIYILKSNDIHVCVPVEITGDRWKISTDTASLEGNALIHIKCYGTDYYFKVEILEKLESDNFAFTYLAKLKDEKEKNLFLMEFSMIERKLAGWNKRREERFEIGFDEERIKRFKLKECEQKVIVNKLTLPCVINNISFSGAQITTVDAHFSKTRKVFLFLSFTTPIEQVLLPASIKNVSLRDLCGQIAATLSLEFEEAPIAYKQRVADYISETKKKGGKNDSKNIPGAEDNNMDNPDISGPDDAIKTVTKSL